MRIGKVARNCKVGASTLKRLENDGLIPAAARDRNGHRRYSEADFEGIYRVLFPEPERQTADLGALTRRLRKKHSTETPNQPEPPKPNSQAIEERGPAGGVRQIDRDEPLMLFRARDCLAVPMIELYRDLCVNDGANDLKLAQVDELLARFKTWADTNPGKMEPAGITRD